MGPWEAAEGEACLVCKADTRGLSVFGVAGGAPANCLFDHCELSASCTCADSSPAARQGRTEAPGSPAASALALALALAPTPPPPGLSLREQMTWVLPLINRGITLFEDPAAAIPYLERAAVLAPQHPEVQRIFSRTLAKVEERRTEALRWLRLAIASNKDRDPWLQRLEKDLRRTTTTAPPQRTEL